MAEVSRADLSRSIDGSAVWQLSDMLRYALSILSAGAGAIHIAVIQAHFEEWWASGVFFAVIAWLQILWAILIVARPSRMVVLSGVAINAIIVGVWVVSRTVGIPLGPESGTAEPVEFVDVAATAFEVLLVVAALGLLSAGARVVRRGALVSSTVVLGLTVAVLASAAIISFSPEHGEAETEHEEQEQASAVGRAR
jgi:hypothetical protein